MSYVLTLVASDPDEHPIYDRILEDIREILGHYEVQQTCQLIWLKQNKAVDIGISAPLNRSGLSHLREICDKQLIDFFVVPVEKRRKKLLLADMDSTIVASETLDDLAEFAGIKDKIAEITEKAMNGEMDFHSALRERVSYLRDLPSDTLQKCMDQVVINDGAAKLVQTMKKNGAICVLVSGGFTFFTARVARMVGFHHHHGNRLEIEEDVLTGKVEEPILDKYAKMEFLKYYIDHLGITAEHCMSIGDGANDIPMLKSAGLGIGYKAKSLVKQEVENQIIHGDLSAALYAQGYID